MITLMFHVESELFESEMTELLSERASVLADDLTDAVQSIVCERYGRDSCDVRCELVQLSIGPRAKLQMGLGDTSAQV